jgi:hypothetical protein
MSPKRNRSKTPKRNLTEQKAIQLAAKCPALVKVKVKVHPITGHEGPDGE